MQLREPVKLLSREGRTLLINVRAGVSGGGLEAGRPDVKYWGVKQAVKVGLALQGSQNPIKIIWMKYQDSVDWCGYD